MIPTFFIDPVKDTEIVVTGHIVLFQPLTVFGPSREPVVDDDWHVAVLFQI
jgi:hypothetical protein